MRTIGKLGDWVVICQVCQEKIYASESVMRYDGLRVGRDHNGCYEERHLLEQPKPPSQQESQVPFTQPPATDVETSVTYDSNRASTTIPSGSFSEDTL